MQERVPRAKFCTFIEKVSLNGLGPEIFTLFNRPSRNVKTSYVIVKTMSKNQEISFF